jgi:hypothetical protein
VLLDLEAPDLEMRPRGRRRRGGVFIPPAGKPGCYAISELDGAIATSRLGARASFPCASDYAISEVDGSIATSLLGPRATLPTA